MKIIHVAAYYPPHLGGIEYVAQNLAKHLAASGHDVTVLTSTVGTGKPRSTTENRVKVKYLRAFEFAHTPVIPSLFFQLIKLRKGGLIHIHLSHVYTEMTVWLASIIFHKPYIAHFHMDVDVSGRLGFAFKLYKQCFLPLVIRRAKKIITLSEEQRQLIIQRYLAKMENVVVIPNGVGDEFFLPLVEKHNKIPKLLFVGRLAKQKNLPRLIKALTLMNQKVEVSIVGDGEKKDEIISLINRYQLKNVELTGPLRGQKLINQYKNADLFVMPSDREGMPLAILEAAAAGLPIIASDVQGLREFVGQNGMLVANPSPDTFGSALDNIIAKPQLQREFANASSAWAAKYRWSIITKEVLRLYEKVLSAN